MDRRRAGWGLFAGGLLLCEVALWGLSWLVEGRMEADGFVLVSYAEPWRSIARLASLALVVSVLSSVVSTERRGSPRVARSPASLVLSVLLAVELSSTLGFREATGSLESQRAGVVLTRTELGIADTEACAHVDLSGWFSWDVGGTLVRPRLLPLPLASGRFAELVGRGWPPGCSREGRR